MNQEPRTNPGFTLAELLIVIAIIAILAVLILLALNPFTYIKKAYDTDRKTDIYRLKNALENYYADHDSYPPNLSTVLATCDSSSLAPYLEKIPCDPNTRQPYASYTTPEGSSVPQHFAIYAPTTSVNFPDANKVPRCPNTLIANSTGMSNYDIIKGCGGNLPCRIYYGCKIGACVIITYDGEVTCSPNSCDSDCGAGSTPIETFCSYPNSECK
jgi:type IV pilus assembly protein PilA